MKHISYLIILFSVLLLPACSGCNPQDAGSVLRLVSYNTENLFNDQSDGGEYSFYDPEQSSWCEWMYEEKCLHVIDALTGSMEQVPDIILLQEIENSSVLEELCRLGLSEVGLQYFTAPDTSRSAVRCGVISRFPFQSVRTHAVHAEEDTPLRAILEVTVQIEAEHIVLLVCHWKSKFGGAEETEPLRRAAARLVQRRVGEILESGITDCVLIAGDLNENPDEYSRQGSRYETALGLYTEDENPGYELGIVYEFADLAGKPADSVFYSPWALVREGGSYVYQDVWERLDHFLLTSAFADNAGIEFSSFAVMDYEFLLDHDGHPLRWLGSDFQGYSDHLPICMEIELFAD